MKLWNKAVILVSVFFVTMNEGEIFYHAFLWNSFSFSRLMFTTLIDLSLNTVDNFVRVNDNTDYDVRNKIRNNKTQI